MRPVVTRQIAHCGSGAQVKLRAWKIGTNEVNFLGLMIELAADPEKNSRNVKFGPHISNTIRNYKKTLMHSNRETPKIREI